MRTICCCFPLLMITGCATPFPIHTCSQAKQAVIQECGHIDIEGWSCWNEESFRGVGSVISAQLFACLDGATTCFEVDSCLQNHGYLEKNPAAGKKPAKAPDGKKPAKDGKKPAKAPAGKSK